MSVSPLSPILDIIKLILRVLRLNFDKYRPKIFPILEVIPVELRINSK
jgi:hypothetical protein